jgi:hypothetical protein
LKKRPRKYRKGPKAKKAFEETMKALFRVPKSDSQKEPKAKEVVPRGDQVSLVSYLAGGGERNETPYEQSR